MTHPNTTGTAFRIPVAPKESKASLRCGGQRIPVTLQETSIEGYTVTVAIKHSHRLKLGRTWTLVCRNERCRVHGEWLFVPQVGPLQVGLRRLAEDAAPLYVGGISLPFGFRLRKFTDSNWPELIFTGSLLSLFTLLSMPGLGDDLGTAPRIRRFVNEVMRAITSWL